MLGLRAHKELRIALVGNPNSGKTTLFNALTGENQQVGNWAGVTVDCHSGFYLDSGYRVQVFDLPGCYSLVVPQGSSGLIDERVACEYIASLRETILVNVVDVDHLMRDLYLTMQLLERGLPVIVVLNSVSGQKINCDVKKLSMLLGCAVIALHKNSTPGLLELRQRVIEFAEATVGCDVDSWCGCEDGSTVVRMPQELSTVLAAFDDYLSRGEALHVLEGDNLLAERVKDHLDIGALRINAASIVGDLDIFIARLRRKAVEQLIEQVSVESVIRPDVSIAIDIIVLHRVYGMLIFAAVMYLLFAVAIGGGGFIQGWVEDLTENVLVNGSEAWLRGLGLNEWLIGVLANGLGRGISVTLSFVPVLGAMFFGLGVLENSGYMVRAAVLVDRLMRMIGLSGKALVPLIVGFGCNVPAIMGARTLPTRRERILTIMMAPFMSCSARLAIYAIFVSAFFPLGSAIGAQNVIFSLYIVGILVAIFTAFALRLRALPGESSLSMMEMPNYQIPSFSKLLRQVWYRVKSFVLKSGALILLLCVLISGIGNIGLAHIGKRITPVFAPMGITQENWPATVGLLTGLVAKETVIGTLNTLYGGVSNNADDVDSMSSQAKINMVTRFGSISAAYAYLLFTLLYFPCVSVIATISKELSKGWGAFSLLWSTGLAYVVAVLFYQIANWQSWQWFSWSGIWVAGALGLLVLLFLCARLIGRMEHKSQLRGLKSVPTLVTVN